MEYIFDSVEQRGEFERLRLIETAFDHRTHEVIEKAGISAGWRCLEVGAGTGSILKWMSDVVGSEGSVIGVDKNTRFIENINTKQVEIIKGDILDVEFEQDFDLIHGRYVLIHIQESEQVISKLINLLKPGGILILEEPDFTSAQVLNDSLHSEHQRVNAAMNQMFVDLGLDPAFGLKLPLILQSKGLMVEDVISEQHLCSGNAPVAQVMGRSAATLTQKYIGTQKASEKDVQMYIENSTNSDFWAVYYATISVIGRKS